MPVVSAESAGDLCAECVIREENDYKSFNTTDAHNTHVIIIGPVRDEPIMLM